MNGHTRLERDDVVELDRQTNDGGWCVETYQKASELTGSIDAAIGGELRCAADNLSDVRLTVFQGWSGC